MTKLVVFVGAIVLLLWLVFGGRRRSSRDASRPANGERAEPMVACAHCGVHLPRGDAMADAAQRWYCSSAHRLAGPREPPAA